MTKIPTVAIWAAGARTSFMDSADSLSIMVGTGPYARQRGENLAIGVPDATARGSAPSLIASPAATHNSTRRHSAGFRAAVANGEHAVIAFACEMDTVPPPK